MSRLRTPHAVQAWLNALPYNTRGRRRDAAQLSWRRAHRNGALPRSRAVGGDRSSSSIGYPPLVLSFESIDLLDHVIFVYRTPTGWGSVARSRDPGLHGRRPLFATPRALALSYFESLHRLHRAHQGVRRRRSARAWATTTGGSRRRTCGRSSRCCSTGRIAGLRHPIERRTRCGGAIVRFATRTATSRGSTTRGGSGGPRCRRSSRRREVDQSRSKSLIGLRDRLVPGLLQRLLEPAASGHRHASSPPRLTARRATRAGRPRLPGCAPHRSAPACRRARARGDSPRDEGSCRSRGRRCSTGMSTSISLFSFAMKVF